MFFIPYGQQKKHFLSQCTPSKNGYIKLSFPYGEGAQEVVTLPLISPSKRH